VWIAYHRAKDRFNGDLREVLDAKLLLHSMSRDEIGQTLSLLKTLNLEHFALLLILQMQFWFGEPLDSSEEFRLLTALVRSKPGQAGRARRRMARAASNLSINGKVTGSRPFRLFNQYLEFLQTPGHRKDALVSMLLYAVAHYRKIG